MAQQTSMMQLFEKLDDLKSVFIYGQKIIPVIHSLLDFMKDTVPLLENINKSIAESTTKIPKAKHHIHDVTNATELATTEILDIVDTISDDIKTIDNKINSVIEKEEIRALQLDEIIELLDDKPEAKSKLVSLKEELISHEVIRSIQEIISKIKNDAYNITISLQVQDITSQQLAAVNHLIESVQERLSSLIITLGETEIKEMRIENDVTPENVHFDPQASYNKETSRQEMADSLVRENLNASQDEIDKLFS